MGHVFILDKQPHVHRDRGAEKPTKLEQYYSNNPFYIYSSISLCLKDKRSRKEVISHLFIDFSFLKVNYIRQHAACLDPSRIRFRVLF